MKPTIAIDYETIFLHAPVGMCISEDRVIQSSNEAPTCSATRVNSMTVMVEASEVSLTNAIIRLPSGGVAILNAWGTMMRRRQVQ